MDHFVERLGITLTKDQKSWLHKQKEKTGLSISEIIRRLLDKTIEQEELRDAMKKDQEKYGDRMDD